jgi:hypothetical protein
MPGQIICKKAFTPLSPSDWVYAIGLDCNDAIWVWFRHGQHIIARTHEHPGPEIGVGGVPSVCCLYPGTAGAYGRELYDLAQVWSYGGEFVHAFLYRKQGYTIVGPPVLPCLGCGVTTACCPGVSIGATLVATISNDPLLNGSYALVYNQALTQWIYSGDYGTCLAAPDGINLRCSSFTNLWELTTAGSPSIYNPSHLSCTPLAITFTGVDNTGCGGGNNATVTVTP